MATGPGPYARSNAAADAADAEIVFDLRLQGLSFREIDILSQTTDGPTGGRRISRSHASDLLRQEIARRIDPKAEEWRTIQLARLDSVLRDHMALRNAHWDRAMGSDEKAPEVAAALAVDRALNGVTRTIAEQNKLLGIATTKIEAQVTEVTQQDIAIQEMVAELKAKNASIEAELRSGAREHPQ
jgi:hypothetical protein